MPGTKEELTGEVRALTGYSTSAIGADDFSAILRAAQAEIRDEVDEPSLDFFGPDGDLTANRALFWFMCLAMKIRGGEIGGAEFSIGELEQQHSSDEQYDLWLDFFYDKLAGIGGAIGMGSVAPQRTDRTYAFDPPE